MYSYIGNPRSAYSTAGASASRTERVPYVSSSVRYASTAPGTVNERCASRPGPVGMRGMPRFLNSSTVARAGAVPCPLIATVSLRPATWSIATHSPHSVYEAVGSTTAAANPAAAAASNALPPARSIRIPAIDTSGWPDAITPCMPETTGRVVATSTS